MNEDIIMLELSMPAGDRTETIHPVILRDEAGCALIDCGFVGSLPLIEAQLALRGLSGEDVQAIMLTHHDHDHMGAAAAFKRKYPRVKVYASSLEAPYISGEEKPWRLGQAEDMQETLPPEQQAFGRWFCDLLRRVEPVSVDETLEDGDVLPWCGGCEVIATPGHTPGHISLWLRGQDTIIAGDAMISDKGRPALANPGFALDMEQARDAMDMLLDMRAGRILCYHVGELVSAP